MSFNVTIRMITLDNIQAPKTKRRVTLIHFNLSSSRTLGKREPWGHSLKTELCLNSISRAFKPLNRARTAEQPLAGRQDPASGTEPWLAEVARRAASTEVGDGMDAVQPISWHATQSLCQGLRKVLSSLLLKVTVEYLEVHLLCFESPRAVADVLAC